MGTQDKIELFGDHRVVRPNIPARLLSGLDCFLRNHPFIAIAFITLGFFAGAGVLFTLVALWPEIASLLK